MSVRNLGELGIGLQRIVSRLMNNDRLVNLLYYSNEDPYSQPILTESEKREKIFNKVIKIVPRIGPKEDAKTFMAITIAGGDRIPENTEFQAIQISVEIFVPLTTWIIKDSNLRPFAILGEVQESLEGKRINGLGTLKTGSFSLNFLTEEIGSYKQTFWITEYE